MLTNRQQKGGLMNTLRDRLQRAAQWAGVAPTQAGMATSLNLNRQTVNRWFQGGEPNAQMLLHIAKSWGVDADWLKSGNGEMLTKPSDGLSLEERDLIKHYRSASPQVRDVIRTMARAVRKSIVTIALVIPPLIASQPSDASVLHNSFSALNTHWRRMLRAWLCVLSAGPVLA